MKETIWLGSRGSALALYQTNWVKGRLQRYNPDIQFKIEIVKTTGDKVLDSPLSKIGDKGLFTKELDATLIDGRIDLAVHSMKDVPTGFSEEIKISAITERWDVRDALVSRNRVLLSKLPEHATIATGSLRRKAQLLHHRPDLKIVDLRGNVNTRLKKFVESNWDALVLAVAGLERLGLQERISQKIPLNVLLPAVGQGSFAVMTNANNIEIHRLLQSLNHPETAAAVISERTFLEMLEGGCQVPIGALGNVKGSELCLQGCVSSLDGKNFLRQEVTGNVTHPEAIGERLAKSLLNSGAAEILQEIRLIQTKEEKEK